jgi:hypothetical protein
MMGVSSTDLASEIAVELRFEGLLINIPAAV